MLLGYQCLLNHWTLSELQGEGKDAGRYIKKDLNGKASGGPAASPHIAKNLIPLLLEEAAQKAVSGPQAVAGGWV